MTKKDLIIELAERTDLTISQASQAVNNLIEIVSDALVIHRDISIRGFATVKTVFRKSKTARNLNNNTLMYIPARRQIKFVTSDKLQKRMDKWDE